MPATCLMPLRARSTDRSTSRRTRATTSLGLSSSVRLATGPSGTVRRSGLGRRLHRAGSGLGARRAWAGGGSAVAAAGASGAVAVLQLSGQLTDLPLQGGDLLGEAP